MGLGCAQLLEKTKCFLPRVLTSQETSELAV